MKLVRNVANRLRPGDHRVSIGLDKVDQSGRHFIRPLVRDIVAAPRNRAALHISAEFSEHRNHISTKALISTES